MRRLMLIALVLFLLGYVVGTVGLRAADAPGAVSQPATSPDTPWGTPVEGLACRIILPETVVLGEPIPLTIELKNLTDHPLYTLDNLSFAFYQYAVLTAKDSAGNEFHPNIKASFKGSPNPTQFTPIPAGQCKRLYFGDIRSDFSKPRPPYRTAIGEPGKFQFVYTFTGLKPQRGVVGAQLVNGKNVEIFADPTPEQVANAWTAKATSNTATVTLKELTEKNLTVHEWGVFSVYNDEQFANVEMKEEWAAMPDFFYTQFPKQKLKFEPAFISKPIIYFYTDRPGLTIDAKVTFAEGAPVIWWPCASSPVDNGLRDGPLPLFRSIEWSAFLGQSAPPTSNHLGDRTPPKSTFPEERQFPEASWLTKARIKGPAFLSVDNPAFTRGAGGGAGIEPRASTREGEHFLYYDGLVPTLDYLRLSPDSSSLQSTAKFPLAHVFLIDRRAAAKDQPVRWCLIDKLPAQGKGNIVWQKTIPAKFPGDLSATLLADLIGAGLYPNEAQSILDIWNAGLWQRPGITAIYLAPQSEYDRILPLSIDPKPPKLVRVAIVVHANLETDSTFPARVAALIAELDDADFAVRERATKELLALAPRSLPLLRKAVAGAGSDELKVRLESILLRADATQWVPAK